MIIRDTCCLMTDASEIDRDAAKAVFGRVLRAQLGVWIVDRGRERFFLLEAQEAMSALGGAPSATKQEVDRLTSAGMLDREPVGRRIYFTRNNSSLWKVFEAARAALVR